MGFIGIVLAVIAFLVMQSVLMDYIPMGEPIYWTISLVVAAWVGWPFYRIFKEQRMDTLRPRARLHDLPVAQVFSKVAQVFDESSVGGRKFDVYVRDTTARRICARMTWRDDYASLDAPGNISPSSKDKDSPECCVEVEINLVPEKDKTVMVMDWRPLLGGFRTEGVINDVSKKIYGSIGYGELYESDQPRTYLPGPPVALVVSSVVASLLLLVGVNAKVAQKKQVYDDRVSQLARVDGAESNKREAMRKEINAWEAFKRRKGL